MRQIKSFAKDILIKIPFGLRVWQIFRGISLLKDKSFRALFFEIDKEDICLDIGANFGHASLIMWLKGAKMIYALEPNKEAYNLLKSNLSTIKNINSFNIAISSNTEKQKLYLHKSIDKKSSHKEILKYSQASSLISQKTNIGDCFYEIDTITFKDLYSKLKSKPTLIKCDIEGGEYIIYEQLIELAKSSEIKKIFVECHAKKYPEFNKSHQDFIKLIKENNLNKKIDISWH